MSVQDSSGYGSRCMIDGGRLRHFGIDLIASFPQMPYAAT